MQRLCYNARATPWRVLNVPAIYFAGFQTQTGATTVCLALAQHATHTGRGPRYVQPLELRPQYDHPTTLLHHRDALNPSPESQILTPIEISDEGTHLFLNATQREKLLQISQEIHQTGNLIFIDGLPDLRVPKRREISADIVSSLDASTILVVWYEEDLDFETLLAVVSAFGPKFLGVLLNGVPRIREHYVRTKVIPHLESLGMPLLGTISEKRSLAAFTVRELANFLGGQILTFPEKADDLVEAIQIGALGLDPGTVYFGTQENKAVITRSDRPDLQSAALETSVRCLVLTGGQIPIPYMMSRDEEKGVPMILVQAGTISVALQLNQLFDKGKPHPEKIKTMAKVLGEVININILTGPIA